MSNHVNQLSDNIKSNALNVTSEIVPVSQICMKL